MSKTTFTTQEYYAGETIVPPATTPTKSGYAFREWSGFPANMIMPAENITVSAVFDILPITFASSDVKQRLVDNIDTNNDGEISFEEAAAVTNINDLNLAGVSGTFNEFKYFTGITNLYSRNSSGVFNRITELTIPPSVQYIQGFYGSSSHGINLKLNFDSSATYNFSIAQQGLQGLYAGTTVPCDLILPEGCTQLGTYAFMDNTFSGTFEIPASVTTLNDFVFSGCTNLQYIKFRGTNPPTVSQNTFKTNVGNYVFEWATFLTIQVPSAALNTYKTYSSAWQAIDQNLTIVGY